VPAAEFIEAQSKCGHGPRLQQFCWGQAGVNNSLQSQAFPPWSRNLTRGHFSCRKLLGGQGSFVTFLAYRKVKSNIYLLYLGYKRK